MNKWVINAIHLKNFKTFDDFKLDFQNCTLITFGGANGFGKTTIFDAIELGLTGSIERFIDVDKGSGSGSIDNVVAKNPNCEVSICIDMSNNKTRLLFKRTIQPDSRKVSNKISNFSNLPKLQLLNNNSVTDFTQNQLEEYIGENDLKKYYNNFFYIRQEDTTHFLRKNEKERLLHIARLFDIAKETEEFNKLGKLKNKIIKIIETYNKIPAISQNVTNANAEKSTNNITYYKLFNEKNLFFEWDRENLIFPEIDTKDKYLYELKKIKYLLQYQNEIKQYHKVVLFKQKFEQIKLLVAMHYFRNTIKDNIDYGYEKENIVNIFDNLENIEGLINNKINLDILKDKIIFDFKTLEQNISFVKGLRDNLQNSDKIIRELVALRKQMVDKFINSNLEKRYCPLCNYDWEISNELLNAIEEKKLLLTNLLAAETNTYNDKLQDLKNIVITLKPLIKTLLDKEYLISNEYFLYLKTNQNQIAHLNLLYDFLNENHINMDDILIKDLNINLTNELLIELAKQIIERIDNKIVFTDDFIELQNEFDLVKFYQNYFRDNEQCMQNITADDIMNKEYYINQMYFKFNQKSSIEIEKINTKIQECKILIDNIEKLVEIYKTKISAHRKKMIKDIEIPFYIYSGKILHSVRDGYVSGVFIKDPVKGVSEKFDNIRFVTQYDSDQDIINTTSSGQLAGIVIALTLAFNRVYSKGINSIFIDDPVQSMDDINMISLVELLRNDFKDKQIFVSSHEAEIEKYMLYKYMKHRHNVCKVDVRSKKLTYKMFPTIQNNTVSDA
ncbi:MAG: hypothetical protein K2P99_07390 [Burkholderiales bacterium]|nr:hypothetical protein [Burkholderiales bacterium]